MATTISTPATFSSVRNAFNAEGFGLSTSFFAYRQGGGIVPNTSDYNVIGAGTVADPLRLSQFSGLTVTAVPSALDIQTVTVGTVQFVTPGDPFIGIPDTVTTYYGYSTTFGSIVDGTSNIYSGASILELYYVQTTGTINSDEIYFTVAGTRANSGWTTMTIGSTVFNRVSASYSAGADTVWSWTGASNPFGTISGATRTITWN